MGPQPSGRNRSGRVSSDKQTDCGPGREAKDQERSSVGVDGRACGPKKKSWGALKGIWVPPDTRDAVVDFVNRWSKKTEIAVARFIPWLGVSASKFYRWFHRYGKVNEHNGWIPRDFWLEDWEKQAIIAFHWDNPLEGYRRLAFMMLDRDIVAVSPTSVWRVLSAAGLLRRWNDQALQEGVGICASPSAA